MDEDALVEHIEQLVRDTREAMTAAIAQLRSWPNHEPLDWQPVAFYIPIAGLTVLEAHAFAATQQHAAVTLAVTCELYRRSPGPDQG